MNKGEERLSKERKTVGEIATTHLHARDTSNAAREAVFNMPELLETIIICLPPIDILTTVQRLSHQWKDAVNTSPTIKAKLGSRSQGVTARTPANFTDVLRFPTVHDWANIAYPMYSGDLTLNPIFHGKTFHGLRMEWAEAGRVLDSSGVFWSSPTLYLSSYPGKRYGQPSFGPSRTWRDMYLTQPPITTGILELYTDITCGRHGSSGILVSVRDHSGITLGFLYDTVVASLGPEFRKSMASSHDRIFWGNFRWYCDRDVLSEQGLEEIFEQ